MTPLHQLLAVAAKEGTFWMPPAASTVADQVDQIYYFIYWICTVFGVGVIGVMIYFAIKYRRKGDVIEKTHPLEGNTRLEIVWSVIPAILLVVIFAMGFQGYMRLAVPPTGSMDVNVYASTWLWSFEYPGLSGQSPHLVVPVNRPVKLTMVSNDVLHSLYIPDFRVKQDVLPSKYTTLWFEATQEGEFNLFCTEYCGQGHSEMVSPTHKVRVLSQQAFDAWAAKGGPDSEMAEEVTSGRLKTYEAGEKLFVSNGCVQCHALGSNPAKIGPNIDVNFKGYGDKGPDGNALKEYFTRSLYFPNEYIAKGGKGGQMPTFKGRLNPDQVSWIYDYIQYKINPDAFSKAN
jgi:cytochrome c oxidase subunit 2